MESKNFNIKSDFDGLNLSCLLYIPDSIKGIIQIVHGMAEHKERYIYFMERLCESGYVVFAHDHRGHGKSIKTEEDLGYFYDSTGKAIVDDCHQMTIYLKNKFKNVPLILFGHSMGSLVVRAYTKKYDFDIDKLIVCGSPSENSAATAAKVLIDLDILRKGDRYISKTFTSLATGAYGKAYPNEGLNSWISKNKQNVDNYNNDPLCGFPFTLNGYRNLMILMQEAYAKKGWILKNSLLPIMFISGSGDPCAESKEKWLKAIGSMKSHGYKNVSGKMYEGYRHEILQEDCKDEIVNDVLHFIESE